MTLDLLFSNFADIIHTPADVKKLKQMILELAMQGKLVQQNPADEPASVLLERVVANKTSLAAESPKRSTLPSNGSLFELPRGWAWCRIGDIFDFEYGKGLPKKSRNDAGSIDVYGSNGIVGKHTAALVDVPCIVIGRKGSSGAINISTRPCWVIDTAYFVIPHNELDLHFVYHLLCSRHLEQLGKGIKPGLTRSEAYQLILALPPLPEQHRIVAKVDQLMRLCDALEARLTAGEAVRGQMAAAVLNGVIGSGPNMPLEHGLA